MKNLYLLPTDKPSRLYIYKDKLNLIYSPNLENKIENTWNELNKHFGDSHKPQNIYIISDDEIKVGDWFINGNVERYNHKIDIATKHNVTNINEIKRLMDVDSFPKNVITKKIILTTDQYLINNDVQSITDDFLEWFVKNPNCESVELKPWFNEILSCCKSESECSCNKKRIVLSNNN